VKARPCLGEETYRPEPIFEAGLPPEQYAYRPGRSAQQVVIEVEEVLIRSHPDVVDADLSDHFGSIPHAELLKSVARHILTLPEYVLHSFLTFDFSKRRQMLRVVRCLPPVTGAVSARKYSMGRRLTGLNKRARLVLAYISHH